MIHRLVRVAASAVVCVLLGVSAAVAHPHVWVTMQSEVVYGPDGRVTGIRHAWTFDDMFSTYALQGLETQVKGQYSRAELAPLAEVNVTSLKEYGFFTVARADGGKVSFSEPKQGEYWLSYADSRLTLHFTLAVTQPVKARDFSFEIYDPTYFVSFGLAKQDPVRLAGAPAGCTLQVIPPKELNVAAGQSLGEAFFNQLTAGSDWGAQFASRIAVRCP